MGSAELGQRHTSSESSGHVTRAGNLVLQNGRSVSCNGGRWAHHVGHRGFASFATHRFRGDFCRKSASSREAAERVFIVIKDELAREGEEPRLGK